MTQNTTQRESFVFYRSFYEAISEADDNTQLQVYKAIADYALNRTEPDLKGVASIIFKMAKPQLDANWRRYENGCKGKEFGSMGGAPKGNKNACKNNPKTTPNDNDNVNVNDNEKENKNEKDIDINPSLSRFFSLYPNLKTTFKNPNSITMEQCDNIVLGMDMNVPWCPISRDNKERYTARVEILNNKLREMNNYTFPHQPISIYDTLVSWIKRDINAS